VNWQPCALPGVFGPGTSCGQQRRERHPDGVDSRPGTQRNLVLSTVRARSRSPTARPDLTGPAISRVDALVGGADDLRCAEPCRARGQSITKQNFTASKRAL
jgi:hypothetical protein